MYKLFSDAQLRNKDIDTLKRYLRYKLGGYRVSIRDISTSNTLFRGVRCNERPSVVDQISYPPPDRITKFGRLNRVGVSMFYCTPSAPAVFYEMRAKQGDLIALSEWEVTEPLWMHNLGFHHDAFRRMAAPKIIERHGLINPIPHETKSNARMRRLLALAFTEGVLDGQEYKYKQSIAINELLFDGASPLPTMQNGPKSSRAAGTFYPALQMRGAADNVAIWPEFVDSSLRIKSLRFVLVEAADESKSSYTIVTIANSYAHADRKILWKEPVLPKQERRSYVALEGSDWVLRDGLNRIYDIH